MAQNRKLISWSRCLLVLVFGSYLQLLVETKGVPEANILDAKPTRDDKSITKFLCDNKFVVAPLPERHISKVSTIVWLHRYLSQPNLKAKRYSCRDKYLEILADLRQIVTIGNDDVCGDAKIKLVEQFHRKYMDKHIGTKFTPINDPIKMFFMRYSMDLTDRCELQMLSNMKLLKSVESGLNLTSFGHEDEESSKFVQGLQKYLGSPTDMRSYHDFVLLWSLVDDYRRHRQSDHKQDDEPILIDPSTGERIGLMVKVKSTGATGRLQLRCRQELRPVYAPVMLPLMRLIDMGYYRTWSKRMFGASKSHSFGLWYSTVQLCESLLPIWFLEDDQVPAGEFVLVGKDEMSVVMAKRKKNPEELSDKTAAISLVRQSLGGANNTPSDDYQLKWVEKSKKLVKLVRNNLRSRQRSFKRILRQVVNDLKGKLRPKLKHFFIAKLKGEKEQATSFIEKSLAKANNYLDNNNKPLDREKRCLSLIVIAAVIAVIVFLVILIILFLLI